MRISDWSSDVCSSDLVHFAAQGIAAGAYDIVIAAGVESMSRIPMGSARIGQDAFGPTLQARYTPGFVSQGVAAELIAQRWGVSRDEMDALSVESHRRAAATRAAGDFAAEIVPVPTGTGEFRDRKSVVQGKSV